MSDETVNTAGLATTEAPAPVVETPVEAPAAEVQVSGTGVVGSAAATEAPTVVGDAPNVSDPSTSANTAGVDAETAASATPTPPAVSSLSDAHKAHGLRLHAALSEVVKVIEEGGVLAEEFIGKEYGDAKAWLENAITFVKAKL